MAFIYQDEDVDLIQCILSGDESAFTVLVERHRKWVHSLAWREIGDFHAAQEITQDTFIQAFKSLPNLKDSNRFSAWLYVIAKRQCVEWLRKKPVVMQSLDAMPAAELEQLFYTQYLEEEQMQASTDELRGVVEGLLQKLPAGERSVMVLHYFNGLTCEEVSERLDVSPNTVKSRLYRARKRLEREESMLRKILNPNLLKSESKYPDNPLELAAARYTVKIEAHEPRIAHVKGLLTPKVDSGAETGRKPLVLSMSRFGTEWLSDGYAHYLRDLTVTDADGKPLQVEEIGKTQWLVETENDGPVTVCYKVLLNHDEREWHWGRDEAPYAQDDCIFWPGYALFIVGEVEDVELKVDVPDNWHISTPWKRISGSRSHFVCEDQNDLMYAYLVLGEHAERLVKVGPAEIVIALGGRFKAAMNEVHGTVEALLEAYSRVFGGTPKDQLLFVANPYEKKGYRSGGVSRRSISLLTDYALNGANRRFWLPLVAHVVGYLWNGSYIDTGIGTGTIGFKEQEYWFCAGFTQYYSRVVCVRLGLAAESDFLRDLERTWEAYLSRQGQLSIQEAGEDKSANRELVYDGGSLVAAALDIQIRNLTQNRSGLDDVMQQMYREFGLTGRAYAMKDVIRIVSQITDEDFEPFFRKYVAGTERLPLEAYLKNAGMEVNIEYDQKLPSLRYVVHEMLQIKSLGGPPGDGMFIHRSPQYQDDDELIGINGIQVKTFGDIRKLAKDWEFGDVVMLTLMRNGEEIILPVTLGGSSEKPPLEVGIIDVTIRKTTDSTDAQRAIWTGMLGEEGHRHFEEMVKI